MFYGANLGKTDSRWQGKGRQHEEGDEEDECRSG